nr:uncharacterized protein LOC105866099 [Microcebus murinus]
MCEFFHMAYCQPGIHRWICKLTALLFSHLSWCFGLLLANSRSWHVWEFDSKTVPIVFIGLWEAVYFQRVNISNVLVDLPMRTVINDQWIVSDEIKYGQALILLANFIKLLVLIFSTTATVVSWIEAPYPDFLQLYYRISAFLLFASSCCTAGTVINHFAADFHGQTTLDFPVQFPVTKDMLVRKHVTYVFPVGVATAVLSLAGAAIFLAEAYLIKRRSAVGPALAVVASEELG